VLEDIEVKEKQEKLVCLHWQLKYNPIDLGFRCQECQAFFTRNSVVECLCAQMMDLRNEVVNLKYEIEDIKYVPDPRSQV
jgi:hypothetical protein